MAMPCPTGRQNLGSGNAQRHWIRMSAPPIYFVIPTWLINQAYSKACSFNRS